MSDKLKYNRSTNSHFDGKKFISPYGEKPHNLIQIIKWKLFAEKAPNKDFIFKNTDYPKPSSYQLENDQLTITFINHSTILIRSLNLTIITDPVFSKRVSPLSWLGPKRLRNCGLDYEDIARLDKIDIVAISHNHYDHLDIASIKKLQELHNPLFLVPRGDGKILQKVADIKYQEMDWWESIIINNYKISFLPAHHWSARGLFDRNQSLWGSFMFELASQNIYFAGDTGYAKHFKEIAAEFKQIDIALLPIGAYEPRWFMQNNHTNPAEAAIAHQELNAKISIPIHYGTWKLSDENIDEPLQELQRVLAKNKLVDQFVILDQGETKLFN